MVGEVIIYTDAIIDVIDNSENPEKDELPVFLEKNAELDMDELFKSIYQYGLSCSSSGAYPDDFTLLGMEVISTA